MASIPDYVALPSCATPIEGSAAAKPAPAAPPPRQRLQSFPPSSSVAPPAPSSRKFSVPTTASLSSNVSDMLLSSLLPPNLPKLPQNSGVKGGPGRPRELSTQREALSLPLVSNNFRRFVTKVGPVFWLQDRIEEMLFWRKPKWTWAFLLAWTFIAFNPRILLLLPSATLLFILLHIHERTNPRPTLLGVKDTPAVTTARVNGSPSNPQGSFTTSTGPDGELHPVVPPKEAESGVDYYMNLQAIQNLMGEISDIYDWIAPRLQTLTSPASSPTTFPLTSTHLVLILLPPTLLLPLLPAAFIPYLLLPLGYAPPLLFHPNLTPFVLRLPRHPTILKIRAILERLAMTDSLDDDVGRCQLAQVEVWENERLDPAVAAKPPAGTPLPPGSWSSKHLRAGERAPWVKVHKIDALWRAEPKAANGEAGEGEKIVLALQSGWEFVPSEEWRVDVCGLWSTTHTDEDGWTYTDDSWQNPAPTHLTDAEAPSSDKQALPGLALRRITRRRRWWRRVYRAEGWSAEESSGLSE